MSSGYVRRLRWPDEEAGPWWLTLHVANVQGVAQLVGIELHAFDPDEHATGFASSSEVPDPLQGQTLRSLPVAQLTEETIEEWQTIVAGMRPETITGITRARGGRPREAIDYEAVAIVWRRCGGVVGDVATFLNVSRSTAEKRIAEARRMNLI